MSDKTKSVSKPTISRLAAIFVSVAGVQMSACGGGSFTSDDTLRPLANEGKTLTQTLSADTKRIQLIRAGLSQQSTSGRSSGRTQAYIQQLADKLVSAGIAPRRGVDIRFENCPALTDGAEASGRVRICRATLQALSTEAELAFLIAHESAHVILMHGRSDADRIKTSKEHQQRVHFFGGPNAETAARAAEVGAFSSLRRSEEGEADLLAVDMMSAAGFNPIGATSFFDLLNRSTLGKSKDFAEEESERRSSRLRFGLERKAPDGGAMGAYLLMNAIDAGLSGNVKSDTHPEMKQRNSAISNYISRFYEASTSRALGVLPWRKRTGEADPDYDWKP